MKNLIKTKKTRYFTFPEFLISTILFLTLSSMVNAQAVEVAEVKPELKKEMTEKSLTGDDTNARVKQLESQVQTMQAEIEALKRLIIQNQPSQTAAAQEKKAEPQTSTSTTQTATLSETKPQDKKDLGVDVGSARLTPYGTIFFNAFSNSSGTNNSDVPLFATVTGAGNTSASVRQTRLGLRLEGARVGNARLGGVLEADFFGGFPAVGIGENFGVVRVRLANARLDWERTSVTVGQDWMVFAPLNPTSLAAAAIPQMASAGNNWARIPQIKIERKIGGNFLWQGAVLAPQTGDYPAAAAFLLQPTSGASSRVPFFQSRFAGSAKNFLGAGKPGTIGLSAHYGRSRVLTGAANVSNNIDSLGIAADWNFPLHKRVIFAGEAFFGRNLGGFQAGIFQSYNPDFAYRRGTTLVAGGVRAIGTSGGWTQVGFTPDAFQDRLTLYGSIGIDDPRNEDLVSSTLRDFRTRNFVYAFDAIYKLTPQFSLGGEFRRMQTEYLLSGRRNANHINLSAAYSF